MAADGFAVIAIRQAGVWSCDGLPDNVLSDLEAAVGPLRRADGDVSVVLINVDDEFLVAARMHDHQLRLLLSDITAAADYELARQALDMLGEDQPDDDELDDVWPAGDLALFADLGLSERELRAILDDLDLYADEMIAAIAGRTGFGAAYAAFTDSLR